MKYSGPVIYKLLPTIQLYIINYGGLNINIKLMINVKLEA